MAIEDDVEQLKRNAQEDRHTVIAGLGAHALALGILHTEFHEFRGEFDTFRQEATENFHALREDVTEINGHLGALREDVTEINGQDGRLERIEQLLQRLVEQRAQEQ